jgi:hypothetical protein
LGKLGSLFWINNQQINQINTITLNAVCFGCALRIETHISCDLIFGRCSDVSGMVWLALNTTICCFLVAAGEIGFPSSRRSADFSTASITNYYLNNNSFLLTSVYPCQGYIYFRRKKP